MIVPKLRLELVIHPPECDPIQTVIGLLSLLKAKLGTACNTDAHTHV